MVPLMGYDECVCVCVSSCVCARRAVRWPRSLVAACNVKMYQPPTIRISRIIHFFF